MASLADKECHTCNRRRVRCDRTLPKCAKCEAKKLECSGYGLLLRWKPPTMGFSVYNTRTKFSDVVSEDTEGCTVTHDAEDVPSEPSRRKEIDPLSLPIAVYQRLLNHYVKEIAPLMIWLDSDQNEYKRLVIPLAETHVPLRLAILAIAAAHAPTKLEMDMHLSQRAYEQAVLLITEQLRMLAGYEDMIQDSYHMHAIEAVLAAALILSNYSLLGSEVTLALVHHQAVRVLLKSVASASPVPQRLLTFLTNQAGIYDILVCTATFDVEHIKAAILPDKDLFAPLLRVLHEITLLSIRESNSRSRSHHLIIRDFQEQLELSQSLTVLASAPFLESCGGTDKEDFLRVVQIFHFAGIVYVYKRLGIDGDPMEEYHTSRLFRQLELFHNLDNSLHNLAWPVFIAGIGSWPNIGRMRIVARLSKAMCDNTQFGHYSSISKFHEELWTTEHHNWIRLAQDWKDKGQPVVPV